MRYSSIRKIIFTGPESTGKSTAAMKMSFQNSLPIVYEYARTFLEEQGPQYQMADLYHILEKQYDSEEEAHAKSDVIICDTDWLTIHVWAQEKFGKLIKPPRDLEERYYIICPPDIPWEMDPLRENPEDRDRLFDIYMEKLAYYDLDFEMLKRT